MIQLKLAVKKHTDLYYHISIIYYTELIHFLTQGFREGLSTQTQAGYTLLELMASIAIVSIVSQISIGFS